MIRSALCLLTLLWSVNGAVAQESAPPDGDPLFDIAGQYAEVEPPQPTADPSRVEVVELFWYGCPHCYTFEPHLKEWLAGKPDHVDFRRTPAVFRKNWIPHAQAYYAAAALGVLDQFHSPLFKALHEDKRQIYTPAELADFVAEQGIDRAAFIDAYNSFAVKSKVKQAIVMTQRYGITGVPAVVINGKYRTSGSIANGFPGVIDVMNVLIEQERKELRTQHARHEPVRATH